MLEGILESSHINQKVQFSSSATEPDIAAHFLEQPNRTLQLTLSQRYTSKQDLIFLIRTPLTASGGTSHVYRQDGRGVADGLLHNGGDCLRWIIVDSYTITDFILFC